MSDLPHSRITTVACVLLVMSIAASARAQWTPPVAYAAQLGQQSLSNSSFVIDRNGHLFAWGVNADGELGIGTTLEQHSPIQVTLPTGSTRWTRVAAGLGHALAIADSDKLYAWGVNGSGQLGIGSRTGSLTPVRVANPPGTISWRAVSAGLDHSLALDAAGRLFAWGGNSHGQLGTSDTTPYLTPQEVPVPTRSHYWSAIAAGAGFSIAVTDRGDLYAWGVDSAKSWSKSGGSRVPVRIATGFRGYGPLPTVAASYSMFSALDRRGARGVWGRHNLGFQFDGFTTAAGGDHIVDIFIYGTSGALAVQGGNAYGQLGIGTTADNGGTILKNPSGIMSWVAVAAGLSHTLAIASDGYLYAWGDNTHGQLGDGTTTPELRPTRIALVGDSGNLMVRLDIPPILPQIPFDISASVTDTLGRTLSAPWAHLILEPTLWHNGPADASLTPALLHAGDSSRCVWSVNGDSVNGNFTGSATAIGYVTAAGSAPTFVRAAITLPIKRGTRPVLGNVIDSISRNPLPGSVILTSVMRDTADAAGDFRVDVYGGYDTITAIHENFNSAAHAWLIPYLPDTLFAQFALDSADVIEEFKPIANRGFTQIYFCDSLVAYAIAKDTVYRSDDAGRNWRIVTRLLQQLTSLVFPDRDEGWVVGLQGIVAHTTDGGATWKYENRAEEGPDLHSVCYANGWVWTVGDEGTFLVKAAGQKWGEDSSIAVNDLRAIHAFNRYHGIAVGARGYVYYRDLDHWNRQPVSATSTFTACFMAAPDRAYLGDSVGQIYGINPADVYATLQPFNSGTRTPIRSLFFINAAVGWAVGDSGATVVTYDSGHTWAPIYGLASPQNCVDFWSTTGYIVSQDTLRRVEARSTVRTSIIRGRVLDPNGNRGLSGAEITLHVAGGKDRVTYSNHKGNYVFTGVPITGPQSIDLYFWDSTGVWKTRDYVATAAGQTATLDFKHPRASVTVAQQNDLGLHVLSKRDRVSLIVDNAAAGGDVTLFNVLGRIIGEYSLEPGVGSQTIDIPIRELTSGSYVFRARSGSTSATIVIQLDK